MKKLFYIVLIIVIIILSGAYIQSQNPASRTPQKEISPQEQTDISEPAISEAEQSQETTDTQKPEQTAADCVCNSECLCEEDTADCDCSQTKSTCSCTQQDGQVVTVESIETNNEDVEEVNPDETADEDETILSE